MGRIFNQYKRYFNNLSESKVTNAITLKETCNAYLNTIKGNFSQITGTAWNEKGKVSASNIFNQMNNNISELVSFIGNNLVGACQKADQLYLKTLEIKECEENLEDKKSVLSEYEHQINYLNNELSREKMKTESIMIEGLQSQINIMQKLIGNITSEINSIESALQNLAEEARILITEILKLSGEVDTEIIDGSIEEINRYLSVGLGYVVDIVFDNNHLFMGPPYSKYKRNGVAFLVTFTNGKTFTVYKQMDGGGYNRCDDNDPWRKYIEEKNIAFVKDENGKNINPLGGGCSVFSVASALSYLLDVPYLDPVIPLSGGGMWGGAIRVLDGTANFEIVSPEGKLMTANIYSDYVIKDYTGNSPYTDVIIESPQEFKDDVNSAFEAGGCVILNTNAIGFTSPDGQHMVTLIGADENGYVIMADSMYEGRGPYKLNSVEYNPDLPYSVNNCPPYMKFNKETGEPFKVDDLVEFLINNSDGTNSYCAIASASLEYVE